MKTRFDTDQPFARRIHERARRPGARAQTSHTNWLCEERFWKFARKTSRPITVLYKALVGLV